MEKKKFVAIILGVLVILSIGYFIFNDLSVDNSFKSPVLEVSNDQESLIDLNDIKSGGVPKGGIGVDRGIPALARENIKFVNFDKVDYIEDNELVLFLDYNGEKRIYPLQIMVWHEIANDEINGKPVAVTYCPLCGSGIAYEGTVERNGERVKTNFGTSGKLYNSNLIMYDQLTDTFWTQIDGLAVTGELVGQELIGISIDTVVWRDLKDFGEVSGDVKVLSQDTGIDRNYGNDPYGNYYEDSFLFFSVNDRDDRIFSKTVVFGIEVNDEFKAYQEDDLIEEGTIKDNVGGVDIEVKRKRSGVVEITNLETGEEIIKERDFWFAWYAFHPDTDLWEN